MPVLFHRGFQDTGFIKSHFSLPNTATFTQASPAVLGTIAAIVLVAAAVVIVYRRNLYREMSPVAALSSIQVHSESKAAKPKDASISNLDHEVLRLMNSVLEKQEDKPIGILKITIYEGKGLKNAELVGKSDPYAVVKLGGVSVGRTRAIQNNLNPAWQQTLYIPVLTSHVNSTDNENRDSLIIELFDENSTIESKSMGAIRSLNLSRWIKLFNNPETNSDLLKSSGDPLTEDERDTLITEWGTPYDEDGSDVWHMVFASTSKFEQNIPAGEIRVQLSFNLLRILDSTNLAAPLSSTSTLTRSQSTTTQSLGQHYSVKHLRHEDSVISPDCETGLFVIQIHLGVFSREYSSLRCEVILGGVEQPPTSSDWVVGKTKTISTTTAVWGGERIEFYVSSAKSAFCKINVLDGTKVVGDVDISVKNVLRKLKKPVGSSLEWHNLANSTDKLKLSFQWYNIELIKPVARRVTPKIQIPSLSRLGIESTTATTPTTSNLVREPKGILRIKLLKAKALPNVETLGRKSDPFAKISVGHTVIGTSTPKENTLFPVWNETFYGISYSSTDHLSIKLWDHNKVKRHKRIGEVEILMSDLFKACEEHKHPPNRQNKHDPQLDNEFSEGYKRLKKDGLKIKVTESRTLSIVAPIYFSKPGSICSPSEAEFGSSKDLAENPPVSSPLMQKGYILFDFEYHETITDPAIQIIPLSTNELEFVQENRAELMKEIDRIVKLKDDKIVTAQQAELKIKQITENRYDGEELGLLMHDLPDVVTSRFDSGILRFKIYGAMNLSTPRSAFIDIHIDNESQFKTQVHEQSTTPSWNTTCDLCLCSFKSQKLIIYIMDNDQENANGSAKEGSKVAQWSGNLLDIIGKKRIWVKFDELENPTSECGVYLSLGYLPIRESLSLALIDTGILHVNIEKAIDLEPIDDSGTSDPYCLVFLNDKPIHKTKTHSKELNPVFNESTSIEVKERLKSNLTIVVKDFNTTTRHVILGTIEVSLSDLGVEKWIQFERPLVGGRKGKLLFQLRFEHPGTLGQSMDGIHEKLSRIETVSTRQESLKRDVSNVNSVSKKVLEGTLGPKQLLSVGMCLDPEDENDSPPKSNDITTINSQTQSQKQLLQGTVTLTIVEAKGLKAVDANGLADPYVKVYQTLHGKELILLKTKCVKKSLNPVWNAQMQFIIPPSVVTLELKDKNLFSGSKPLGEIELDMESLFNASNEFDAWLDVGLGGTGSVHVVGKFDSK